MYGIMEWEGYVSRANLKVKPRSNLRFSFFPVKGWGFSVFLVFMGAVKFYLVSNFSQTNKKIPK